MTTRKRSRRIPIPMERAIESLAVEGHEGRQIHAELIRLGKLRDTADQTGVQNAEAPDWAEGDVPDVRTVQRIVKDHRPTDPSGTPWALTLDNAEQAAAILRVQAGVAKSHRVRLELSVSQANWVWSVSKIAPDLSPWWTYRVGLLLWRRDTAGEPTTDLQGWLAFRPWASDDDANEYSKAIDAGLVPLSPLGPTGSIGLRVYPISMLESNRNADPAALEPDELARRGTGLRRFVAFVNGGQQAKRAAEGQADPPNDYGTPGDAGTSKYPEGDGQRND
jgi:hypothetical protein